MASPNSRQTLIDYCLRALGAPLLEINVADEQLEDRIDEAMQFWQEYHSDAAIRTFVKHTVTQDDLDSNEVAMDDSVLSVIRIVNLGGIGGGSGVFSANHQLTVEQVRDSRSGGGIVGYEMLKQHIELVDDIINGHGNRMSFSRHMNTLTFHTELSDDATVGDIIIIECYSTINPDNYSDVYNDMALKELATLYIKKQWGVNLTKFEGMQLPGGITINGQATYDSAVSDIKEMKETWDLNYSSPPDFFIA